MLLNDAFALAAWPDLPDRDERDRQHPGGPRSGNSGQSPPHGGRPVSFGPDNGREDAMLVARMAAGDREALARLYDRLAKPLFATATRILRDPREAEDVVHDIFLAMWEKAGSYDPSRGTPFAWAVTLTRNKAIDRHRTRNRRADLLAGAPLEDLPVGAAETAPDSAEQLDSGDRAVVVRRALATLPGEQQKALQLAFFSGLTQQEIAEQLQEPLGTIKARIRRGLLKLRDQLASAL